MLIDPLPVLQPQAFRDFPARRRQAAALHETTDKSQHFQLLGTEIGHVKDDTRRMSGIESSAFAAYCKLSELEVIRAWSGAPVRA